MIRPVEAAVVRVELDSVRQSQGFVTCNLHVEGTGGGAGRSIMCQTRIPVTPKIQSSMHTHTRHAYSHDIFRHTVTSNIGL